MLYGLGLIPFGYAHFANVKGTAELVPGWLPWHVACAYFTGRHVHRGGRRDSLRRLRTAGGRALGAADGPVRTAGMGAHPVERTGNAFQWAEFATTLALTAGAWVVADSYRGMAWLADEQTLAPAVWSIHRPATPLLSARDFENT